MIKKQGISLLLSAVLVLSLCGCGQEVQETTGSNIELMEPVSLTSNVEKAAYRNIYNFENFTATVYPTVTEYSYTKNVTVDGNGAFWGEEVKKGEVLVSASTESIDKQIESMEERIASMDESMAEALETLNENLEEPRKEETWLKGVVEAYEKAEPEEKIPASQLEDFNGVTSGDSLDPDELVDNPEYLTWQKENDSWLGRYRILAHNINMQEESYRQSKELYDLERAYLCSQLEDLKKERNSGTLKAKAAGEVVARKTSSDSGSVEFSAQADQAVVAVGDMDNKILLCEYINKTKAAASVDMFAVIDGVRYEVEYHAIDNDEYKKITESGGKAYTTFTFLDDCSNVEVGDFATVTVFSDKKENVLSVPKGAIHKDSSGYFVYVMKDGQSVLTNVKTGITDGIYTEIVSGLAEGDAVLVENAAEIGKNTASIAYGSFNGSYEEYGKVAGAMYEVVGNPVEYGTTYFGEYQVEFLQHVEKGDVIATIRVAKDEITIQRYQQKIQRAQERLADLKAAGEEDNKKAIEAKQEEIQEMQELLAEMEADANTTVIRATKSGMIAGMAEYEAETILYHDSYVVDILDETSIYISVEDPNQLLNYGNEVTITYNNQNNQQKTSVGTVANIGNAGLSKDLQSDQTMIMVPKEDLAELIMARPEGNNWNWRDYRPYKITAKIRQMENVLVVPRAAVTEVNGRTYVNVMDEQGNVKACSFVAGGYDNTNYWVIEGLSEGMVVCLK